jgi:hypothetical protein
VFLVFRIPDDERSPKHINSEKPSVIVCACIRCRGNFCTYQLSSNDKVIFTAQGVPCGGGIEYLHRSPASRKRRRKGTQCPEVYLGHPVPLGYKYRDLALQVGGVSRIGTMKYVLESHGTQTESNCAGETSSNSKLQTHPLVREGATK